MSKRKLLLADDSITIQKVVNLTFADEGIEVFTVSDGDAAMEKLREFSPDLIMADVNMPGLNGYQICESIRRDETLRNIPVILLVGSFEPFDEEEAQRVGANDFLTKPFQSIRQLVNKVTELLNLSDNEKAQEGLSAMAAHSPVSSFDKTLEMPVTDSITGFNETLEMPKASQSGSGLFDYPEIDDEMIQTNQVSSFSLDESQKFETKNFADVKEEAETEPLSAESVKDFAFDKVPSITSEEQLINEESAVSSEEAAAAKETSSNEESKESSDIVDYSAEPEEDEISLAQEEERLEDLPLPSSASILDLDDDILELPPIEGEEEATGDEEFSTQPDTQNIISEPTEQETTTAAADETDNVTTANSSADSPQFSPELIDAIAQRVIEKLSDKTIREIAWEVVPQQADLIIKKMVEEKLKE